MGIEKTRKLGVRSKIFLFSKMVQDYRDRSADIGLVMQAVGHSLSLRILLYQCLDHSATASPFRCPYLVDDLVQVDATLAPVARPVLGHLHRQRGLPDHLRLPPETAATPGPVDFVVNVVADGRHRHVEQPRPEKQSFLY